jgi:signal transduction histidine kinase
MPDKPLRLEIDAHVIRQLGDELITDTGQALLELVKNSYDADASFCHVDVETRETYTVTLPSRVPPSPNETDNDANVKNRVDLRGRIEVKDNGEGMTIDTIRRGWLTISLSPKRAFKLAGKTTELYHRTPLGDKGLGRIGTLKLGTFVVIKTHHDANKPGWRVSFSWGDCEGGGLLSEVPVGCVEIPARGAKGTVLTIYGLSDLSYWRNERSLENLRKQLSTLISPFKTFEDFDVRFTFDSKPAPIETAEDYLSAAQGKFSATWQASDSANELLEVDGALKLMLFRKTRNDPSFRQYVDPDKGAALFTYLKKDKRLAPYEVNRGEGEWFVTFNKKYLKDDLTEFFGNERYADPGPLMAEIYDIDIVEAKSLVASKKTDRPKFIDDHHGIFIYRDNFRIRMGDDWLGLGQRQTRGGSYYGLRPGNTLGWVSISAKDNKDLVEKSDREGFVDNAAKRGFEFVLNRVTGDINDFITACRRAYNDFIKDEKNAEADRPAEYDDVAALAELKEVATAAPRITAALTDASTWVADVGAMLAAVRASFASNDSAASLSMLGENQNKVAEWRNRVESNSKLVRSVTTIPHAVETIAAKFEADETQLRELYALAATGLSAETLVHEISDVVQGLLNALADLDRVTYVLNIRNAKFLSDIKSAQASGRDIVNRIRFLDPMLRNVRAAREEIDVSALLSRYDKHKRPTIEKSGIALTVSLPQSRFIITANKGRILQVLDNLINNSLYWLSLAAHSDHDFKPAITIKADKPIITVSDNGPGVDERVVPRLFEPFVSGRADKTGHGLGLYLSQELLKQELSAIRLLDSRNGSNRRYEFEMDLSAITDE